MGLGLDIRIEVLVEGGSPVVGRSFICWVERHRFYESKPWSEWFYDMLYNGDSPGRNQIFPFRELDRSSMAAIELLEEEYTWGKGWIPYTDFKSASVKNFENCWPCLIGYDVRDILIRLAYRYGDQNVRLIYSFAN